MSLRSSKSSIPAPPPEVTEKMKAWKAHVKEQALKAINETMAQKCLALNERLQNDPALTREASAVSRVFDPRQILSANSMKEMGEDDQGKSKKRKLDSEHYVVTGGDSQLPSTMFTLMDELKKESLEFIDTIHTIRIFIQLNVPKIEDGNNFGVSVQEEVMNELTRAEESAFNIIDQSTKYFVSRGKLLSKVLKYPNLEDYAKSIQLLDEKQYLDVRLAFKDLRNSYAILDDLVQKNLDKLMMPRSSHTSNMF